LLWSNSRRPEVEKPAFGIIGAVADDEMVAIQRFAAHVEPPWSIGISLDGVANHQGTISARDAYNAVSEIFMELNPKRVQFQVGLNIRATHVAIGHRAFDVDFVFVIGLQGLFAREHQYRQNHEIENDS